MQHCIPVQCLINLTALVQAGAPEACNFTAFAALPIAKVLGTTHANARGKAARHAKRIDKLNAKEQHQRVNFYKRVHRQSVHYDAYSTEQTTVWPAWPSTFC